MATADNAAALRGGSQGRFQQALQNLNALSQRQKIAAAAAVALAVALVAGALLWNQAPAYGVLFSNLDQRDGGQIIAALQQQNIPYRMSPDGNAILIPEARVHETRLRLAADGLPKGGLVGFELMDGQKLGISQFNEQVNYQRALEGELSRTIGAIAAVSAARVHLAMPKQTAFLRDDQRPTASVMLQLRPGRALDDGQVAGIVHLVSSSVPRMTASGVSVVNQNGELLTGRSGALQRAGLDPTQLDYVRTLETGFIERIQNMLVPLVGRDNFRAEVVADVDFNQVEQTAETYKPNPSPDQAIRSQQSTEAINPLPGAQGVPGALSNQPPAPATAPITTAPGGGQGGGGAQAAVSSNRSAVLNYELDRSIQHIRQATGQIRRLSVAVVLNNRSMTGPNGQQQSVPLTDDEINRIRNLVREAVGYNEGRGDTINVANASFTEPAAEPAPPLWKDPEMIALGKEGLNWLLVLAAILLAYFGVIRPLLRTVLPPPPPARAEADEDTTGEEEDAAMVTLSGKTPEQAYEERLDKAKEMARTDPQLVAELLKEWLGANEENRK